MSNHILNCSLAIETDKSDQTPHNSNLESTLNMTPNAHTDSTLNDKEVLSHDVSILRDFEKNSRDWMQRSRESPHSRNTCAEEDQVELSESLREGILSAAQMNTALKSSTTHTHTYTNDTETDRTGSRERDAQGSGESVATRRQASFRPASFPQAGGAQKVEMTHFPPDVSPSKTGFDSPASWDSADAAAANRSIRLLRERIMASADSLSLSSSGGNMSLGGSMSVLSSLLSGQSLNSITNTSSTKNSMGGLVAARGGAKKSKKEKKTHTSGTGTSSEPVRSRWEDQVDKEQEVKMSQVTATIAAEQERPELDAGEHGWQVYGPFLKEHYTKHNQEPFPTPVTPEQHSNTLINTHTKIHTSTHTHVLSTPFCSAVPEGGLDSAAKTAGCIFSAARSLSLRDRLLQGCSTSTPGTPAILSPKDKPPLWGEEVNSCFFGMLTMALSVSML